MIEYIIFEGTAHIGQVRGKHQGSKLYIYEVESVENVPTGLKVRGKILQTVQCDG